MASKLLFHVFLHSMIATATVVTPTTRVVEDILNRPYDKDTRPVNEEEEALAVTIIPNLFILLSMDQTQETITFSNEFLMVWKDSQLAWNGSEYGYNKEWVKLPEERVWTPDIIFDLAMSITERLSKEERLIDLKNDGTLRMSNPSVIEYPCSLQTEAFPYDVQVCNLSLSSWNFEMSKLILHTNVMNISTVEEQFDGNSEWDLEEISAVESNYTSGNAQYSQLIFRIRLRRKPVYYVLVIQAPTFIISTLTIFGLFTPFNQHGERREKASVSILKLRKKGFEVTLGLNMFVAISMMLTLVSDMMPKASRLPLLGNYILAEIFVCSAGCLLSLLILLFHHRCYTRVLRPPEWFFYHNPLLYLPRVHRFLLFDCAAKRNNIGMATGEASIQVKRETPADSPAFAAIRATLLKKERKDGADRLNPVISMTRDKKRPNGSTLASIDRFQAVAGVRKEIEFQSCCHEYRKTWFRVFDRIDTICVITFQLFNVIVSVLFMR